MKKDAYYFPHFCNARHDRKIKRVLKEIGIEGYAIYFMTLEVLREQQDFRYPIKDIDLLADEFGTSEAKMKAVIEGYELFETDDENNFFSIKQIYYLQPYLEMKEQRRLAGIKSGEARKNKSLENKNGTETNGCSTNVKRELNENEQSKVKESKVNKSKEDNIRSSGEDFSELDRALLQFEEMRKKMKKPLTDDAKKLVLEKLKKLAPNNEAMQIEILQQSVISGWQGIFPIKQENTNNNDVSSATRGAMNWLEKERLKEREENKK